LLLLAEAKYYADEKHDPLTITPSRQVKSQQKHHASLDEGEQVLELIHLKMADKKVKGCDTQLNKLNHIENKQPVYFALIDLKNLITLT